MNKNKCGMRSAECGMRNMRKIIGLISLIGLIGLIISCKTPEDTAYKASKAIDTSADAALAAWSAYVSAKHPPVEQELKVQAIYDKYIEAQKILLDAAIAYKQAPVDTRPLNKAIAAASSALSEFISIVESSTKHK